MSVAGHPLFKYIMEYIIDHYVMFPPNFEKSGEHTLHEYTGPLVYTRSIKSFLGVDYSIHLKEIYS